MKKISKLFGLLVFGAATVGATVSCRTIGFRVGLLCLHGQTSTYDKNFIDAFEKACAAKGLTTDDYDIRTNVAEDYNKIYTAAKEWAEDGYDLIFADSFGHQYGLINVAKEYPDTQFCHATGTTAVLNPGMTNYHNAFAHIYKGRYLAGVAAGQKMIEDISAGKYKLEDARIGYVGAWPYAEVISGYTSFYLGACSVFDERHWTRPEMYVYYTYSWYDYGAEKVGASELINSHNCKLISQHADSMGAPQVCATEGVPNICYNVSTKDITPETYIYGCKINWQPYFEKIIGYAKDKYDGKTVDPIPYDYANNDIGEAGDGAGVEMLDFGKNASEVARKKVEEAREKLEKGELHVFDCSKFEITIRPITDQNPRNPFAAVTFAKDELGHETKYINSYIANVIDDPNYTADTEVVKQDGDVFYIDESNYDGSGVVEPGTETAECLRSAPFFELIIDGITELNRNWD